VQQINEFINSAEIAYRNIHNNNDYKTIALSLKEFITRDVQ
jgi:hypothetical protein